MVRSRVHDRAVVIEHEVVENPAVAGGVTRHRHRGQRQFTDVGTAGGTGPGRVQVPVVGRQDGEHVAGRTGAQRVEVDRAAAGR